MRCPLPDTENEGSHALPFFMPANCPDRKSHLHCRKPTKQGTGVAEPNTSGVSLAALLIAAAGPVAGQYGLIVMGALAGAMWPIKTMKFASKLEGALFLLRIVITAVFLSGSLAWYLSSKTDLPVYEALAVVSLLIGAMGNGWGSIFRGLREAAMAALRGLGGGKNDQSGGGNAGSA